MAEAACPKCGGKLPGDSATRGEDSSCPVCGFPLPSPANDAPEAAPAASREPAHDNGRGRRSRGRKIVALAGGLVVALAGLAVLGSLLYRSLFGGLGAYAYYVPEQTRSLARNDYQQLRESSLDEALLPRPFWIDSSGMNIHEEDIEELFDASPLQSVTGVAVVRTRNDEPLAGVCTHVEQTRKHAGVEYAEVAADPGAGGSGGLFIAKTGKRTYLVTRDEEAMKRTLERLQGRKKWRLRDPLQRVLDRVSRFDNYVVSEGGSGFFGAGQKHATGFGYTVTDEFAFEGVMIFAAEEEAESAVATFRRELAELRRADPLGPSPEQWQRTVELLASVRIQRHRSEVRLSAVWPTEAAQRVFQIRQDYGAWGRLGQFVQHFMKPF